MGLIETHKIISCQIAETQTAFKQHILFGTDCQKQIDKANDISLYVNLLVLKQFDYKQQQKFQPCQTSIPVPYSPESLILKTKTYNAHCINGKYFLRFHVDSLIEKGGDFAYYHSMTIPIQTAHGLITVSNSGWIEYNGNGLNEERSVTFRLSIKSLYEAENKLIEATINLPVCYPCTLSASIKEITCFTASIVEIDNPSEAAGEWRNNEWL